MKSKVKRGKGFKGCVSYVFDTKNKHNEKPDLIASNMSSKSHEDFIKEFIAVRECRTDIERPVWHTSLSLPKGETLTDKEWQAVAEAYLTKMGFDIDNNQYLIVRHKNTDQDHIHIVANRIGLDGSVWHGKREAFKSIEACQQVEKEFLLSRTQGLRGSRKDVSMPSQNEIEQAIRTGEKPARVVLQNALQAALCDKPDLQSLITRLQAVGIEPRFNVASTGNVAGVSFSVRDVAFKGSTLGKKFSWNNIKGVVKYDQDRDDELVRSFSARKANESVSDERSDNKSSLTHDRAIGGDNADTVRVDSADIRADTEISERNIRHIRSSSEYYKIPGRQFSRTLAKVAKVHQWVKAKYPRRTKQDAIKSRGNLSSDKYTNDSIARILDYAEATANASSKFRQQGGGNFNSSTAKIEALRKRLSINPKPVPSKSDKVNNIYQVKNLDDEKKKMRFKERLKTEVKAIKEAKTLNEEKLLNESYQHKTMKPK